MFFFLKKYRAFQLTTKELIPNTKSFTFLIIYHKLQFKKKDVNNEYEEYVA